MSVPNGRLPFAVTGKGKSSVASRGWSISQFSLARPDALLVHTRGQNERPSDSYKREEPRNIVAVSEYQQYLESRNTCKALSTYWNRNCP